MIYLVVHPEGAETMETFVRHWKTDKALEIRVITYESLFADHQRQPGTFVFSDLERVSIKEREMAMSLRDRLVDEGTASMTLNDPVHTLTRRALLEMLHSGGVNDFRVHPITADLTDVRLPAFIRNERSHTGPLTDLISNERSLRSRVRKVIRQAKRSGVPQDDLLIVEYVDTRSTDGVFRKYSTFIVGETTVARHLLFSRDWMIKVGTVRGKRDLGSQEYAAEELEYVRSDPHSEWIKKIGRMGSIEYGRIDYGFKNGRPQIWEVNLNPTVCSKPFRYDERQMKSQLLFARRFTEALIAVDSTGPDDSSRDTTHQQRLP